MRLSLKEKALAAGGLIGALGVASCCLLPLLLLSFGIGGARRAAPTSRAPYRTFFLWGGVAALGFGFSVCYFKKRPVCADGSCEPTSGRAARTVLWVALLILGAALLTSMRSSGSSRSSWP